MIDADVLLGDTKKQVVALVDDLRNVVATDARAAAHVEGEYSRAHAAGRTAFGQAEWAEGLYSQVAVAWVLGCVFVRFCEDNELIDDALLGGPGIRSQIARDHRAAHLQAHPADDDRHWLREVFGRLRSLPATGDIFGSHNPVWADGLMPSADGARKLREELTRLDPETGELRHNFTDPSWDTRFLGDLYQDLSEHAKKTYALLQTPVFVEEFILDRTLDPAIATFGLADATIIDPTCGSGHFLLGAFARLFHRWVEIEPATNRRELARRSIDAIGGIDLNPFAASIARFRLLVAALRAGGDKRLVDAPAYEIHVAVGDSLLHGDPPGALPGMHTPGEEESLLANHGYESEDIGQARKLLGREWTAVVGNPPYIIVKDPALNQAYRSRFPTCHRQYSLGVPFTERFWQLARVDSDQSRAGYIGMITANSFMKGEFGRKLIEDWFPAHEVTHILDTSGVYVPGHGTPTVILLGRNRHPRSEVPVRCAMGIRSEPARPAVPAAGLVWRSIVEMVDREGAANSFVSVADIDRRRLSTHPWSLSGGGSAALKEHLEGVGRPLESFIEHVGYTGQTNADDAFLASLAVHQRFGGSAKLIRRVVVGEEVRDYSLRDGDYAFFPYADSKLIDIAQDQDWERRLWPLRTALWARATFSKQTYRVEGRPWWEWHQVALHRLRVPLSIAFVHVSTHNHFVLDRAGLIFNRSAPIIKLRPDASEDDHLRLLATLNSSSGCFWMKQVFPDKGSQGVSEGLKSEAWERFYNFDGTKLKLFPVPVAAATDTARTLDSLAQQLMSQSPAAICQRGVPTRVELARCQIEALDVRRRMIAAQEHLDWQTYGFFGLTDGRGVAPDVDPPLSLGERAFEIVLARRIARGEEQSTWFTRHGSTPITDLPTHWPEWYTALVEERISLIEESSRLEILERPENKRRWLDESWESQLHTALREWLSDRLEQGSYWDSPALTTVARLSAAVRHDEDFIVIARMYCERDDLDLGRLVEELVFEDSVPYLAVQRHTEAGLAKYQAWRRTWQVQRREDDGESVGPAPAPPKFSPSDFTGMTWRRRGKFDMPKERFISYPGAERETDATMVIGWAGWNHLDRARALAAWYLQARRDGRDAAHLTPLLAGLAELVPWLEQWYDEPNPDPALDRPGTQIAALVDTELRSLSLTHDDLDAWRPEKKRAGRARKAAT